VKRLAALATCLLLVPVTWAADPAAPRPARSYSSTVDGDAGRYISGVASINLVAGRGNAQANLAAIAFGPHTGARASGLQATAVEAGDVGSDARVQIGDGALAAGTGVLAVNQAAGAANAQLNLLGVGTDDVSAGLFQSVDVTALAVVASGVPLAPDAAPAPPAAREARIEGTAFANPQGVLQLNQTAGVGNASANAIVLQLPGGTP